MTRLLVYAARVRQTEGDGNAGADDIVLIEQPSRLGFRLFYLPLSLLMFGSMSFGLATTFGFGDGQTSTRMVTNAPAWGVWFLRPLFGGFALMGLYGTLACLLPRMPAWLSKQVRLAPGGWAESFGRTPRRLRPWEPPTHDVRADFTQQGWEVRVVKLLPADVTQQALRILETGQSNAGPETRTVTLVGVTTRLSPSLHRQIAEARAMAGAERPTHAESLGRPSHCPECGYPLHAAPADAAGGVLCPECGFHHAAGEIVLYGRAGPSWAVSSARRPGWGGWLADRARAVATILFLLFVPLAIALAGAMLLRRVPLPSWSVGLIPVLLVMPAFFAALWLIRAVAGRDESDGEKGGRERAVAERPGGPVQLRLGPGGFGQRRGFGPMILRGMDRATNWRVQRWPGGVRVRADASRGPLCRCRRPVDLVIDDAEPTLPSRLRRRVREATRPS